MMNRRLFVFIFLVNLFAGNVVLADFNTCLYNKQHQLEIDFPAPNVPLYSKERADYSQEFNKRSDLIRRECQAESVAPVSVPVKAVATTSAEEKPECLKSIFGDPGKKGSLTCPQLYHPDSKGEACLFSGTSGVSLSPESSSNFRDIVDALQPSESKIFEAKTKDGNLVNVGIVRQSDGAYAFTSDGIHYYDNLQKAAAPGFLTRFGNRLDNIKRGFLNIFGIDKYTGADTSGPNGKENQQRGQLILNASNLALDIFHTDMNDPEKRGKVVSESIARLGEGNYGGLVLDKIKDLTGCSVPFLDGVLKKMVGVGEEALTETEKARELVLKLSTVPGDAVVTLGSELKKADFAKSAALYIQERESGSDPKKILGLMLSGNLPELDLATNIKGFNQQFAQSATLSAYEEAYQRYLVAKGLSASQTK